MVDRYHQARFFKHPITDLWNIIKDTTVTVKLLSNSTWIQLEPIFLNGINSYENDSQYVIPINKERVHKVEEVIESDYFYKIKRVVFNKRTNEIISKEITSLHYIDECITLLVSEYDLIASQTEMIHQSKKELQDIQKHYFIQIEKGILNRQYKRTNYVGKKFNASFNYVLSFLSNVNIMANISGTQFETINHTTPSDNQQTPFGHAGVNSQPSQSKPRIRFIINKQQIDVVRILVKHRYLNKDTFIIHLLMTNENNKIPSREMIVQLHGINENECFVVYRHNFFNDISEKKLAYISSLSNQLLDLLNKVIIHFNIKNLNK